MSECYKSNDYELHLGKGGIKMCWERKWGWYVAIFYIFIFLLTTEYCFVVHVFSSAVCCFMVTCVGLLAKHFLQTLQKIDHTSYFLLHSFLAKFCLLLRWLLTFHYNEYKAKELKAIRIMLINVNLFPTDNLITESRPRHWMTNEWSIVLGSQVSYYTT